MTSAKKRWLSVTLGSYFIHKCGDKDAAHRAGLENSWNAWDCCGYTLENRVVDVGFLLLVQASLAAEFNFLQITYLYGIDHNNA